MPTLPIQDRADSLTAELAAWVHERPSHWISRVQATAWWLQESLPNFVDLLDESKPVRWRTWEMLCNSCEKIAWAEWAVRESVERELGSTRWSERMRESLIVLVSGSVARLEATAESDIDLDALFETDDAKSESDKNLVHSTLDEGIKTLALRDRRDGECQGSAPYYGEELRRELTDRSEPYDRAIIIAFNSRCLFGEDRYVAQRAAVIAAIDFQKLIRDLAEFYSARIENVSGHGRTGPRAKDYYYAGLYIFQLISLKAAPDVRGWVETREDALAWASKPIWVIGELLHALRNKLQPDDSSLSKAVAEGVWEAIRLRRALDATSCEKQKARDKILRAVQIARGL
jgi:hypothetical protein